MTPSVGSALSLAAASGLVCFERNGETWTRPLVGYAVVVTWVRASDPHAHEIWGTAEYQTDVEPVFLEDGSPITMTALVRGREDGLSWRVLPA